MVGLTLTVAYAKISSNMVSYRDMAGNAEATQVMLQVVKYFFRVMLCSAGENLGRCVHLFYPGQLW